MINSRISADWSTTKPIAAFSCTTRVQEVHTKAEVVNLPNGLLGLGVLLNCHVWVIPGEINMKNGRPLQISLIIGICVGGVRISN